MSEIKISIVIPNYNHAHYLPTSIEHALQQLTPAHEILIIDDGSTDNSLEVIQQYATKHPQIRLLQNAQNMGVNFTLNRGLHEATGTHVTFAAADDWMANNLLQVATELLEAYPDAGLVSGSYWITYENNPHNRFAGRMPYPLKHNGYISPYRARKLINTLDSWFAGNTVVLNRIYALQESGYRSELLSFTDNFLCRVLAAKHGCCFTPIKLATWRICEGGFAQSVNLDVAKQQQVIDAVMNLMSHTYANIFCADTTYKVKQRFNFSLARTIWNNGKAHHTPELKSFLNSSLSNWLARLVTATSLKITSKLPYRAKLGSLVLFLALRPFDLWQQVRISTHRNV